jgi:hypothetical protein
MRASVSRENRIGPRVVSVRSGGLLCKSFLSAVRDGPSGLAASRAVVPRLGPRLGHLVVRGCAREGHFLGRPTLRAAALTGPLGHFGYRRPLSF